MARGLGALRPDRPRSRESAAVRLAISGREGEEGDPSGRGERQERQGGRVLRPRSGGRGSGESGVGAVVEGPWVAWGVQVGAAAEGPGAALGGTGGRRGRGPGRSQWGPGGRCRWIWREAPRQAVWGSDPGFSQRLVLGPQGFSEGTARNGQRPVKPGQWRPGEGVLTPVRCPGPAEAGCSPEIPRRKRSALPGCCPSGRPSTVPCAYAEETPMVLAPTLFYN